MHVDGSHRDIAALNLALVMGSDEEKAALVAVKSLDLSHNRLEELIDLEPMTSLLVIDAGFNRIHMVSGMPRNLTKLLLPHNAVRSFHDLSLLPSVVELDLSHNELEGFDGVPQSLISLKVSGNAIRSFEGLGRTLLLEHLDVGSNAIGSVDDLRFLAPLESLKTIVLAGNPVSQHPTKLSASLLRYCSNVIRLDGHSFVESQRVASDGDDSAALATADTTHTTATSAAVTERESPVEQVPDRKPSIAQAMAAQLESAILAKQQRTVQHHAHASSAAAERTYQNGSRVAVSEASASASRTTAPPAVVVQRQPQQQRASSSRATGARRGGDSYAAALDMQRDVSRESIAESARQRNYDEQLRTADAAIRNQALLLDEERKTSAGLRKTLKLLEKDLADSKRIVSDELGQVAHLRASNAKLSDEIRDLRTKLDKALRDLKFTRSRAESMESTALLKIEQSFARFDADSRDLREELAAAQRAAARALKARDIAVADAHKLRNRVAELEDELRGAAHSSAALTAPAASVIREASRVSDHISLSSDEIETSTQRRHSGAHQPAEDDDDDEDEEAAAARAGNAAIRLAEELRQWVATEMEEHEKLAARPVPTTNLSNGIMIAGVPLSAVEGIHNVSTPSVSLAPPPPAQMASRSLPLARARPSTSLEEPARRIVAGESKWKAQEELLAAAKLNNLRQQRHP